MGRKLYRNVRILDPASGTDVVGDFLLDGNLVADYGARVVDGPVPEDMTVIDGKGLWILPGLVDMRAYLPGGNNRGRETLTTASHAAVAGGITTFVCTSDADPVIDNVPVLEAITRRGRDIGLASVLCYAALTRNLQGQDMTEMGLLYGAGAAGFMDGMQPVRDSRVMLHSLKYAKLFGALVLSHPEDPALTADGLANQGPVAARLGLRGIPACAESIMVARDLELLAATGGRLHLCHLSTARSVELVRQAKAMGLNVTCDATPFHFLLNDAAVEGYETAAKLNPPLRSEDDRQAVLGALADGTIDAIVSDHTPYSQDRKRVPFAEAAFGAVGFETLLSASLQPVFGKQVPLLRVLGGLTSVPADILGLGLGRLQRGQLADFVLFDPQQSWTVTPDAFRSKSRSTPFAGRKLQGRVVLTIKSGKSVFKLGRQDEVGRGD